MSDSSEHLSDEVILQFIDNELPATSLNCVQEHLAACPVCRDRQLSLRSTSDAVLGLYRSTLPKANGYDMASRVRLKTRLVRSRQASFWRRSLAGAFSSRLALGTALVSVFTVLIFAGIQVRRS